MRQVKLILPVIAFLVAHLGASAAHGMYDPKHGRWLQRDPLGVTPGLSLGPVKQYKGGACLYLYVSAHPTGSIDPQGLCDVAWTQLYFHSVNAPRPTSGCNCGQDVTGVLSKLKEAIDFQWARPWLNRQKVCENMVSLRGWDIREFVQEKDAFKCGCPGGACSGNTISVNGSCYNMEEANYWLWGYANYLCNSAGILKMNSYIAVDGAEPWEIIYAYTLPEALEKVAGYRATLWLQEELPQGFSPLEGRLAWTAAGYSGSFRVSKPRRTDCCPCAQKYRGLLTAYLGHPDHTKRGEHLLISASGG